MLKWRDDLLSFAANFEMYIDDIRVCSYNCRKHTRATKRIASQHNYLGIQDALKEDFPQEILICGLEQRVSAPSKGCILILHKKSNQRVSNSLPPG